MMNSLVSLALMTLASAADLDDLLRPLPGEYVLAIGPGSCPQALTARVEGNSVELKPEGSSYSKVFSRIGKKRKRVNDDFGTYNDYRSRVVDSHSVISETRVCQGLMIIRCSDWSMYQQLEVGTGGIVVSVPLHPHVIDYSGFPLGESCGYRKN